MATSSSYSLSMAPAALPGCYQYSSTSGTQADYLLHLPRAHMRHTAASLESNNSRNLKPDLFSPLSLTPPESVGVGMVRTLDPPKWQARWNRGLAMSLRTSGTEEACLAAPEAWFDGPTLRKEIRKMLRAYLDLRRAEAKLTKGLQEAQTAHV
ncbi:hypothetical protein P171DRAFT_483957 [Karstenula rhodostoma CBS 690.94]|uniref:Uncharacterized protein n=1 Tax=Karstenula rhodostoma CBS 690.94 TaxID=1392251 RepID=A0A9P4PPH4_9PLEO|nr:hypothetical protein P171DRAFT_483957 [Karstenula rhodostoma CBS 690.94]